MRILDLEQNQAEWHTWRTKGIGASDATIIMNLSPWFTREQLLKRKSEDIRVSRKRRGKGPAKEADNGAMARGRRLEPVARDLYTSLTGIRTRPVCVIHDEIPWMRASLDGLSEDNQIVLEIKCVNFVDHSGAIEGLIPPKYVPQVQHQLFVTGLPLLHYWSYTDNEHFSPRDRAKLVTVRPIPDYQEKLLVAESAFWKELTAKLENPSWLEE